MVHRSKPAAFLLVIILSLFGYSCGVGPSEGSTSSPRSDETETQKEAALGRLYQRRAQELVASMDDSTLAAQVLLSAVNGSRSLAPPMEALLRKIPVGGVLFFKYNLDQGSEAIRGLSDRCVATVSSSGIGVAPFVAVDHEGGSVYRLGTSATHLPSPQRFAETLKPRGPVSAAEVIEESAYLSGKELRALGINFNVAPVAEVLNDQNKEFLGSRTYGRDGDFVATAASAFVLGMDRAGVACVVKHFPGNGTGDPHHGLVILKEERGELEKSVAPFIGVLKRSNPGALMVSHTIVPALDPKNPSSLSKTVMTGWLKKDLAFPGILLADDFRMGAIAALSLSPSAAVLQSIAAGADMVMTWPQDLERVHGALVQALAQGTLDRERLRDAARRIVYQKLRYRIVPPGTGEGAGAVPSIEELPILKKATETYLKAQLGNLSPL